MTSTTTSSKRLRKGLFLSSSSFWKSAAHPQETVIWPVLLERAGGRTDRLLSKTCFSSNSVLDRKIMIWHWLDRAASIFRLLLRFMIVDQFSPRNNILMPHQSLLKFFMWFDGMCTSSGRFLQLQNSWEKAGFSEAEVILSSSDFSSGASSHQSQGRSPPVTNIVNNKMSERKWGKKAGGIFETQIMQGNHFSAQESFWRCTPDHPCHWSQFWQSHEWIRHLE